MKQQNGFSERRARKKKGTGKRSSLTRSLNPVKRFAKCNENVRGWKCHDATVDQQAQSSQGARKVRPIT